MLHLIIRGKWKSPNHSKNKSEDDTHAVKKQILAAVGKYLYEKKVGTNPDIDVDPKTGKIQLKGRGKFDKKGFQSELDANEYFELLYLNVNDFSDEIRLLKIIELESFYVIPPSIEILDTLLKHLIDSNKFESFVIAIR
ncbi:hypothetical protein [Methylophilus sp.]|jgi:hypothetical protein|uniref:hypothetical protein n=1 Tax=Methylophilus sp. TaxID=29541 RepID=UPI0011D6A70B|nr:hypothetical protein [Methylophilus sp.]TXI46494.1 MAG: hypothetical protein E6Q52_02895 [Methylophilus sp.]